MIKRAEVASRINIHGLRFFMLLLIIDAWLTKYFAGSAEQARMYVRPCLKQINSASQVVGIMENTIR